MKQEKGNRSNFKPTSTPIAVVGISCMFPKAGNLYDYWTNIKNGVDSITEVPPTHWNIEDYFDANPKTPDCTYAVRGGFIDPVEFDPFEFGVTPNAMEATDTSQLLGLVAAKQALQDAGYWENKEFDRDKVSVILGVTGTLELVIPLGARLSHPAWRRALKDAGVADSVANEVVERISDSYVEWQENSFPGLLGNVAAGRIANRLDLRGTNCVVDAACASSLGAMHMALLELSAGRSDMVITGGLDTFNDIFMYMCFSKTMVLSQKGDAKPFDRDSDGTILGEGLGMLVLKRLDDAERDNDKIYAVIKGVGSSSDGKGNAVYVPSSEGQAKALRNAYKEADITPDTVELVEAHGTGTKIGDASEVDALTDVYRSFRNDGKWCALGSVKAQIGHTKAAAGMAGLIKVIMALRNKVLPPTIKVDNPIDTLNSNETPFYLNPQSRPWIAKEGKPRRASVSAFGFGGSNFHCVVEEYGNKKEEIDWDPNIEILSLCNNELSSLKKSLKNVIDDFSWEKFAKQAAESRKVFSPKETYRLIVVINRVKSDVKHVVNNALEMLEKHPEKKHWNTPDGVNFSCCNPEGKLGFIFPGQGSQYINMQRELSCQFPQMQAVLVDANKLFAKSNGKGSYNLTDYIYPFHSFDKSVQEDNKQYLQNTEVVQSAIGAVSLGMFEILSFFGIKPDTLAGHSYGELTALCASACLDHQTFHNLSRIRGELMSKTNGVPGSMIAAWSDDKTVALIIEKEAIDLVIANKNAPNQTILSGSTDEIKKVHGIFKSEKIKCKELAVSSAFHSPFMAKAAEPFHNELLKSRFGIFNTDVFANSTAEQYPADPECARQILTDQIVSPVEFVKQIENMYESGVKTFLEVGPGNKLAGLIKATLADKEAQVFSMDVSSGKNSGIYDLALTLSGLAVSGYKVDLEKWNEGIIERAKSAKKQNKPTMTLTISGTNYVKPKKKRHPKPTPVSNNSDNQNYKSTNEHVESNQIKSNQNKTGQVSLKKNKAKSSNNVSGKVSRFDKSSISEMYRITNENMITLQKMQENTSKLHQQFLSNQESSLKSLTHLMEQQRQLLGLPGTGVEFVNTPNHSSNEFLSKNVAPEQNLTEKTDVAISEASHSASSIPETSPQTTLSAEVKQEKSAQNVTKREKNSSNTDFVCEVLLSVVSEKTGYPVEMLELDMSLDSDLGIDSIKRVEILSALQEKLPNAPEVRPEHMGMLSTLRHIVDFISESDETSESEENNKPQVDSNVNHVKDVLLDVVSEKTGYPVEMLELDMSLDSDLGIDSIKRVEILSALQEKLPNAPEVKPEHMGVLNTLRHIIEFIAETDDSEIEKEVVNIEAESGVDSNSEQVLEILLSIVADKTGYPVEMIDVNMNLDSDLGIDSIKRVEILSALQDELPGLPEVKPEHMGILNTLKQIAEFLTEPLDDVDSSSVSIVEDDVELPNIEKDKKWIGITRIERSILCPIGLNGSGKDKTFSIKEGSQIWVTDDGTNLSKEIMKRFQELNYESVIVSLNNIENIKKPEHIGGLVIVSPPDPIDNGFLKSAFKMLQVVALGLRNAGQNGGALFVTVTRLDGEFGLNGLMPKSYPISGGLAGLTKTAKHEWPEVNCKALDIAANLDNCKQTALMVVNEVFTDGSVEIGISKNGRNALILKPQSISESDVVTKISDKDVIIIAGGARGVTAEVSLALARTSKPILILLGRSKEPENEPNWLASAISEGDIKKAIIAHSDVKMLPKDVEEQYKSIIANREILNNIDKMKEFGSKVFYYSVDVRDANSVELLINDVREKFGVINGLIHGAGVLADRLIEEKTVEQFDSVYTTKVTGLLNLLNVLIDDNLKFMALFSSFTGRYGRVGQVDYAVANEVLNKIAQQQSRIRPSCRVVSVNWGPWDGGMVTPSLKKIFEDENVGLIDPQVGANYLIHEMCANADSPVEVVVMGCNRKHLESVPIDSAKDLTLAFELELNTELHPFLLSHVIDNKAVLPMAMIIEWAAHAALHLNPGLIFYGFDDLRVLKGVTLARCESLKLQFFNEKASREDGLYVVPVELQSEGTNGKQIVHARTKIILVERITKNVPFDFTEIDGEYKHDVTEIYKNKLFHGEKFQGIKQIQNCGETGISASVDSAPLPETWIKSPLRNKWVADPLLLDSSFQMMILWCFEKYNVGSLPCFAGKYRQYKRILPSGGVRIIINVIKSDTRSAWADISFVDDKGECVAQIKNYESILSATLNASFSKNCLNVEAAQCVN